MGNLYKHSVWPQLRKGTVPCEACRSLQTVDAQSSEEMWKRPRDKSLIILGGEQGRGYCIAELFPTQWTLVLYFQCLFCCTFWKEIGIPKQGSCCVWTCALPMCFSIFSFAFSEALSADDSHILPAASPGSSLFPVNPAVPALCELTAPGVTTSQAHPLPLWDTCPAIRYSPSHHQ